jgi:ribonuclease E
VKQYRDGQPLFSRMGVESQLDAMFSPTVQLRSGGYIVINQTEALVSIDVNSGRSTREHHIEDTALKTNLEAAEEVARQLRLRDLAGLIVIDFIDMDEKRNNRAVERKLSDCLRQDRARIQVGRISHFGLLEMSRQRIRASVLESSTEPCAQCGGTGHVRSVSSVALQLLRGIEEILMKGATHNLNVRTRTDVALYVLNHKRGHLRDLESSFKVSLAVVADPTVSGQQSFIIDRGEQVHTLEAAKALLAAQAASAPSQQEDDFEDEDEGLDAETESEIETEETEGLDEQPAAEEASGEGDGQRRKRRRRRRGRGGEAREGGQQPRDDAEMVQAAMTEPADGSTDDTFSEEDESDEQPALAGSDQGQNGERRPRRRGRRGGRRRRGSGRDDGLAGSISDELTPPPPHEATDAVADFDGGSEPAPSPVQQPEPAAPAFQPEAAEQPQPAAPPVPAEEEPAADERAARRRSTVREKVSFMSSPPPDTAPATPAAVEHAAPAQAPEETAPSGDQPRKAGWWSRRFGGG